MDDVDLLESVLAKDVELIRGVSDDARSRPTMCPDYDVEAMVNHLAGWAQVFADGAQGQRSEVDASAYSATDPAAELEAAAARMVGGWRELGVDRTVSLSGGELPGQAVLSMTVMEFVTHGLDLALGSGQAVPFTDAELEATLERAKVTLPDEFRGPDKAFGAEVEVSAAASAAERLLGFMGRTPPSG